MDKIFLKKSIINPEEAVKLVKNRLKYKKKEYFLAILLDAGFLQKEIFDHSDPSQPQ